MNWLKRTLGICTMSVCLLFGGVTNASAETLQTVFKNSLWGSAIGGVSGLAFWALQDEDKEDKLFHPSNLINGDVIKKNLKIEDGPILGDLLNYLSK